MCDWRYRGRTSASTSTQHKLPQQPQQAQQVEDAERRCEEMRLQNAQLANMVSRLSADNVSLKQQLATERAHHGVQPCETHPGALQSAVAPASLTPQPVQKVFSCPVAQLEM